MPARVYVCDAKNATDLKKLLEYDPYLDKSFNEEQLQKIKNDEEANIIFARQDYILKDGISLNMDREKYYLYINAADEFLVKAERKLKKSIPNIERLEEIKEKEIIETLDKERHKSEQGLGLIFG